MENEATKLEIPEHFREAIGVLAAELVELKGMQVATAKLVQAMDLRLKLVTKLIELDHAVLEKHGMVPPRPPEGGDLNVN